ncbi:hypothetical protein SRHO_G00014300 [Serrasalmus rhombeus]
MGGNWTVLKMAQLLYHSFICLVFLQLGNGDLDHRVSRTGISSSRFPTYSKAYRCAVTARLFPYSSLTGGRQGFGLFLLSATGDAEEPRRGQCRLNHRLSLNGGQEPCTS